MGIFEYQCVNKHTEEYFGKHETKPDGIECSKCGELATPVVSAVATTFHANDRRALKRHGK